MSDRVPECFAYFPLESGTIEVKYSLLEDKLVYNFVNYEGDYGSKPKSLSHFHAW